MKPPMRRALPWAMTALACLGLAACSDRAPEPEPEETPALQEENLDDATDRASIIRPDIEIARTVDVEPLEMTLSFGSNGTALTAEAVNALDDLLQSPQVTRFDGVITLRGHSDAGGNDAANLRASQDRADVVAAWLIDNGIDEERIVTIAFGEQNPIAPNALPDGTPDEEGRSANRRVEVTVAVPEGASMPAPAEPTPQPEDAPGQEAASSGPAS